MTLPFNKYQIQLNPDSITSHRYLAVLSPLQFIVKWLRTVQINSMELVKLWANLDFRVDKRQQTQVVTVEFWLSIRKNLSHSQALEEVAQRDVASSSFQILKTCWAKLWATCSYCTYLVQAGSWARNPKDPCAPQGFCSSKFSPTVV